MLFTLNIVLGLIFVILLVSLLASTVMEVIAAALSLRSKHLESFLRTMMVEHFDDFMRHPLFKQIANATSRKTRISNYQMPAWVNKDTFTAIIGDMLEVNRPAELYENIENLDEGDVKRMLQFLYRRSEGKSEAFVQEMEFWFDEVMERATAWYRRKMKWWLFGVGLALAVVFNIDTIATYHAISKSSTVQEILVEAATQFEANNDTVEGPNLNLSMEESLEKMEAALERVDALQSPLGLGWHGQDQGHEAPWWLVKILGWLLTAIAVTFGAPFWFDLLKKVLSIRRQAVAAPPQAAAVKSNVPAAPEADDEVGVPTRLDRARSFSPPPPANESPEIDTPPPTDTPVG